MQAHRAKPRSRLCHPLVALLVCLATCPLLLGCDRDFGDQALRFVNQEVHGLSRAHVESELDNIISQAFQTSIVRLATEAKLAASISQDFSSNAMTLDPQSVSNHDVLAEFNRLDTQAGTIVRLISRLEANALQIQQVDATCIDDGVYTALEIDGIGGQGPIAVVTAALKEQKAEISISASGGSGTPGWVSLGELVASAFGANETKKQNDKVKEAIRLLPEKVVHGAEVRDIYQTKCGALLEERRPDFTQLQTLTDDTRKALTSTLANVQAARAIAEGILRTRDIQGFLASTGVTQALSDAQNLILQGQLRTDVALRLKELRARLVEIRQERQCTRALASVERYSDELNEFRLELKQIRAGALPPDEAGVFDQAIAEVDSQLSSVPDSYRRARKVCR